MRLSLQFIVLICLVVVAWGYSESLNAGKDPRAATGPARETPAGVSRAFNVPLSFEENQGQTAPSVRYMVRGPGYTMFFTSEGALLSLPAAGPKAGDGPGAEVQPGIRSDDGITTSSSSEGRFEGFALEELAVPVVQPSEQRPRNIQLKLVGANPDATIRGFERLPAKSNYLLGNDPSKWRRGIPHYAEVKYEDIYPGIGLVYYGNQGELEFDFILEPGADPGKIQLEVVGADELRIGNGGDLIIATETGQVVLRKPIAYQEVLGSRRAVELTYYMPGKSQVGLRVGDYDTSHSLVIDPVLAYSTRTFSTVRGMSVDSDGNVYVMGDLNYNVPTVNSYQVSIAGASDLYISKIDASGTGLVYSTFLGGSGLDWGYGLAVDPTGSVHLTGYTYSEDFPIENPYQPNHGGGTLDAFVTKLDPTGAALVFSSYLGGTSDEIAYGVAADSDGRTYVVGQTWSSDFPTKVPYQGDLLGGYDAFVAKFESSGTPLIFSTYLGGLGGDVARGVAVDQSGNTYVTGRPSIGFPMTNIIQSPASLTVPHIFVTKLDSAGTSLLYSSGFGGSHVDIANGIAVDSEGNAYLVGYTQSSDFPVLNPIQALYGGPVPGSGPLYYDAFVSKLNSDGTGFTYSTYLGGSEDDTGFAISVDQAGNAHVIGATNSEDFPTFRPIQSGLAGGLFRDAFFTKIGSTGEILLSSYLGGTFEDVGWQVSALSPVESFLSGSTMSADFQLVNPLQNTGRGFVVRILDLDIDSVIGSFGGVANDSSSSAQVIIPAGVLSMDTSLAIDVLSPAPVIPIPGGYSGAGTQFVTIQLFPQPTYPLPTPGLTIVLPLASAMTEGSLIDLFVVDGTGNLVPKLDGGGNPIVGSVDAGGFTATFTGVVSLSTLVGLIPEGSSVLTVEIDIKPGEFPNSINLGSKGTVPAAIFGGPSFDAAQIDPISLRLAGASVRLKGNGTAMASFEDVNGDGYSDLVVHFNTQELLLKKGDTEAVATGQTYGGIPIEGRDSVQLVP